MKKELKIALYCILAIAIVVVVWLMFGNTNPNVEIDTDIETPTEEDNSEALVNNNNTDTFEEDVMKDLEWFFGNNNGYEDVQWEYWFTSPESE